jgi:Uma2 family endonuclease
LPNEIVGHLVSLLGAAITLHVVQHNLGYTVMCAGFRLGNNDFMPDVVFIANATREKPVGETWITVVPDLVLEVNHPPIHSVGW